MSTEEQQALVIRPSEMVSLVERAATDPNVDVAKMTALWELAERMQKTQAQIAYQAAMARLQAKLKPLTKTGHFSHMEGRRFVQLEDMDNAIRPLMTSEGFSFSFDEEAAEGSNRRYVGKMSHEMGHAEVKRITLAVDSGGGKNATQAGGSTASYAQKYLLKMHLNLVQEGDDTDGVNPALISDEQRKDIETALGDTKSNVPAFLKHFGVAELKSLPARQFKEAMTMIDAKRRNTAK